MKCKRCEKDEAKYDGLCISCSRDDEYAKEYSKDVASIFRAEHLSPKQIEDFWRKK